MKAKIFIDGSEGTTGLRIHERFQGREDIEPAGAKETDQCFGFHFSLPAGRSGPGSSFYD